MYMETALQEMTWEHVNTNIMKAPRCISLGAGAMHADRKGTTANSSSSSNVVPLLDVIPLVVVCGLWVGNFLDTAPLL